MVKFIEIVILLAIVVAAVPAQASDTLRCGSRLVSTGDTKAEVLIKCGKPAWRDAWTNEIISGVNTATEQRVSVDRERWTYNFGSHSFLEFLLFENGKLIKISEGDYGFDDSHPSAKSCEGDNVAVGLTQYEILQRCGEPFFKDTRSEERLTAVDKSTSRVVDIRIDEWTYNFGPNRFLRVFKFENGELVDIETGDRGF